MASEVTPSHSAAAACNGSVEVFPWLKTLPVAPEYHPTLAEFQDPIAYIFKIEKEASQYGICKIVPPVCPNPKKTALSNLNKSLIARSGSGPTFTTRQQQIGFCPRKHRPVQKPVWQSGENYTLQEFEAKAKVFEKNYLKKCTKKCLTPLDIETLYWKATADKPFSVEYANDMPGSAFALKKGGRQGGLGEGSLNSNMSVGETEWNMRGVARAKGSLLTFMKEEIPGVTSPMLYIAMMFSWFAWHVEDHDLHSLNYLHMGAGKTWYGVPRDAAGAFEEVIRVQGYGGESNPLVTFDTLGEKTTVMSPEVLVDAGVPCCRLVQNAGEFVVTFPRAYHSGFSHGFNCGEASNIATPEWLRFAKDAAIRRASINSPPMVSHFQLLYDLALSFCSRKPKATCLEPRSSRLKDKKKGEGEMLVKQVFVQDVMRNNDLMHMLAEQPSVVIIPQYSVGSSFYPSLKGGSKLQADSRLSSSLCSSDLMMRSTNGLASVDVSILRKQGLLEDTGGFMKGKFISTTTDKKLLSAGSAGDAFGLASQFKNVKNEKQRASRGDRMNEQGLFSCVTCGILCFSCVAVIQPTDTASDYLITADCSALKHWEETNNHVIGTSVSWDGNFPESGWVNDRNLVGLFDVPLKSGDQVESLRDQSGAVSNTEAQKRASSLGLLALTYGNSSDSEDEAEGEADCLHESGLHAGLSNLGSANYNEISHSGTDCINEIPLHHPGPGVDLEQTTYVSSSARHQSSCEPLEHREDTCMAARSNCLTKSFRHQKKLQDIASNYSLDSSKAETAVSTSPQFESTTAPYSSRSDEDSSRMHVFCLQHAVQVQQKLRFIGGANILLLCHPDYPNVQAQAKTLAEELGTSYTWDDVSFRTAFREDEDTIRSVLESQDATHGNGDWAVKLGIDLFYSANLSRSPLYCKQMPYNFIIYNAFGPSSQAKYAKPEFSAKGSGKAKKMIVAGKWCGRVWMSNQVHLYLAETEIDQEQEQERNFASRVKAEGTQAAETTSGACTTGEKRKSAVDIRPIAKAKSAKSETGEDSSGVHSAVPLKSNTRIKQFKKEDAFPQNTSSRSKKLLHSNPQDELEPLNTCGRSKRQIDLGIEDVPKPPNTCGRSKRQIDLGTEDVPKPTKVFTRKKKDIKVTEDETGPSRISTRKKKRLKVDNEYEPEGGGPSTRLRKRISKSIKAQGSRSVEAKSVPKKQQVVFTGKKGSTGCKNTKASNEKAEFPCDMEGCSMSFSSKHDLALHKKNICPVKGCGKKFFSHKYLVQHRRVHVDDRPLKCPWKGCNMTFKWAWARTEHIRVHTGARPYVCSEPGCGQTFRFVSDFSRHKRKTGHSSSKKGR